MKDSLMQITLLILLPTYMFVLVYGFGQGEGLLGFLFLFFAVFFSCIRLFVISAVFFFSRKWVAFDYKGVMVPIRIYPTANPLCIQQLLHIFP